MLDKFLTRENAKVNDKITGRRHILRTLLILHKLTLSFLIDIPSLCPGCLLNWIFNSSVSTSGSSEFSPSPASFWNKYYNESVWFWNKYYNEM